MESVYTPQFDQISYKVLLECSPPKHVAATLAECHTGHLL